MKVDRRIYLGFAVLGLFIPYSQFVPYIIEKGLNIMQIIMEISGSRIAVFGWLDVLISSVVLIVMILEDKDNIRKWWLPVIATFTVGVSCGLPLFMYLKD